MAALFVPFPSDTEISASALAWLDREHVSLADAITTGKLTGYMQSKGKQFEIRSESGTGFQDLRGGPAVLVGLLNNGWTDRLSDRVRFHSELDWKTFTMRIRDAQNPGGGWTVDGKVPYLKMTEDYGIITRALDPTTERTLVVAGGLTRFGTIAAGEFLTDGRHMESFAARAPRDWERRNIQVVIATKVIQGQSGPPRIVSTWFW
jgi:hypothetical protein